MNWKALYVSSRAEKKVLARLIELGIEAYVPLKKEKRQWSDRKKMVITPLINGYVFVKLHSQQRDMVFRAEGVIQYVRFNGGDAIIREDEINALKLVEEKGYFVEGKFDNTIKIGDYTEIKHGPFAGFRGTVEKSFGENVFQVCIESIGYVLKVNVPTEVLKVK